MADGSLAEVAKQGGWSSQIKVNPKKPRSTLYRQLGRPVNYSPFLTETDSRAGDSHGRAALARPGEVRPREVHEGGQGGQAPDGLHPLQRGTQDVPGSAVRARGDQGQTDAIIVQSFFHEEHGKHFSVTVKVCGLLDAVPVSTP